MLSPSLKQDGEAESLPARRAQAALLVWITLMLFGASLWS